MPVDVGKQGLYLYGTGRGIDYSADGLYFPLFPIDGTIVKLEANRRHFTYDSVNRTISGLELPKFVFRNGEIGIHFRIVRHHCKRLFDGGTDECADAVRERAYNPVTRTLDFGV